GELLHAVELIRGAEQAEACVVDDHVRLETALLERRDDRLCGIGTRKIGAENRRSGRSFRRNGVRQRAEDLLASCNQDKVVAVGAKSTRGRGADPRRRAGDQRDGAFLLRHGVPRRLATRWPSSILSREEMPSRSAARQIRFRSNSSTSPSA